MLRFVITATIISACLFGLALGVPVAKTSTEAPNHPLQENLANRRDFDIPAGAGAPAGVVGKTYYIPSWKNYNSSIPGPIVAEIDSLYHTRANLTTPGRCLCPNVPRPATVVIVSGSNDLWLYVSNGTECAPHTEGCVPIGHTVTGKVCSGAAKDGKSCIVATYAGSDNHLYYEYELTHPAVCACIKPEVSLEDGYGHLIVGNISSYEPITVLVFNKTRHSYMDTPINCVGEADATVRSRNTADGKFAVADVYFDFHVDRLRVRCYGIMTNFVKYADFGVYKFPYKVCNCSGHSVADQYPLLHNVFPQCTANGECICQPGWHGPNCEQCLAEGSAAGCHATNWIIWIVIGSMLLTVIAVAALTVYCIGKTTYKKLKGE